MTRRRKPRRDDRPRQRKMWVRTDSGDVVWVEGEQLPDPEAVRAADRERRREAREAREREAREREPIRFKCPVCKTPIAAARGKAGEQIRCRCGQRMLVPEPPEAPKLPVAVDCLSCGKPHLPSADRCDRCGDMLPIERSCGGCGQLWLRRTVNFCPRCGLELEG